MIINPRPKQVTICWLRLCHINSLSGANSSTIGPTHSNCFALIWLRLADASCHLFGARVNKFSLCFVFLISACVYADCSKVPLNIRQIYAQNFYQAFATQCQGKSTSAFCQFQLAYKEAKNAGENILRLMAMEQLFGWYRMYGSSLGLFAKQPEGHDRIIGEYPHSPKNLGHNYHSEWGNSPEQSALIREFMLGVAETISGVFCASVTSTFGGTIGWGLIFDGSRRMYLTLNNIWSLHERAKIDFKKWEETAKKVAELD